MDLYAQLGEPVRLLRALYLLAGTKASSGLDASGELARLSAIDCSDAPLEMRFMQVLAEGAVIALQGYTESAIDRYQRALPLAEAIGDRQRQAAVLLNLMDMEMLVGRLADAIGHGEALLASLSAGRASEMRAIALHHLAAALIADGALERARPVVEQGLALAPEHAMLVEWSEHLALLAALDGRATDAAQLLGYGDAHRRSARANNEAVAARRAQDIASTACGTMRFEQARALGRLVSDDRIPTLGMGRLG